MKLKLDFIFICVIFFVGLSSCSTLNLDIEANDITEIGSRAGRYSPNRYSFINYMVGDTLENFIPRDSLRHADALILKSKTIPQITNECTLFKQRIGQHYYDDLEDYLNDQIISTFGMTKYRQTFAALKNYAIGNIHHLNYIALNLDDEQIELVEEVEDYIDKVVKPFSHYILQNAFDDAETHEECYDIAVQEATRLGLEFVLGSDSISSTLGKAFILYNVVRLIQIMIDYDDCVSRVNGW